MLVFIYKWLQTFSRLIQIKLENALLQCNAIMQYNNAIMIQQGTFEWGRVGYVTPVDTADVLFMAPGFPDVVAFAASNSTVARTEGAGNGAEGSEVAAAAGAPPRRFLRFSAAGMVGVSTGQRRGVAEISAAIAAARLRADVLPPRLQSVAALALPTLDVLAWNTLFTTR